MTDFKQNVFQGRSVLAEKDFSAAELNYLVDFGLHLKALKKSRCASSLSRRQKHCLTL